MELNKPEFVVAQGKTIIVSWYGKPIRSAIRTKKTTYHSMGRNNDRFLLSDDKSIIMCDVYYKIWVGKSPPLIILGQELKGWSI